MPHQYPLPDGGLQIVKNYDVCLPAHVAEGGEWPGAFHGMDMTRVYRGRDTGRLIDGCEGFWRHEGFRGWHPELIHSVCKETDAPATADAIIAQLGAIPEANGMFF